MIDNYTYRDDEYNHKLSHVYILQSRENADLVLVYMKVHILYITILTWQITKVAIV